MIKARGSRLRSVSLSVSLSAAALFPSACSGSVPSSFGDASTPTPADSGKGTPPPHMSPDAGSTKLVGSDAGMPTSADGSTNDCPPSAKLIYVTGSSNDLYSYAPETAQFTLVGTFDCLEGPTHMTVDRQGTAWVVANSLLYTASTSTAHCTAVPNWTAGVGEFVDFSLTFVGTTGVDNTLYVVDDSGRLASFDTVSGARTLITSLSGLSSALGDMTSNGDGHLYFIHDVAAQTLYEITPTTGAIVTSWVTGETGGSSEALAYYGGLFYDFLDSDVFTFDPTTKVATSIGTAPLEVTGAGQSTCVPTSAPPPAPIK